MSLVAAGPADGHLCKVKIFAKNNQTVAGHRIIACRFTIHEFDDPDIYAAEKLREWEQSDAGQWIMSDSLETPTWYRQSNYAIMGYIYIVVAWLSAENVTFFNLKFQ